MSLPIPPGSNPLELLAQLKQDLQSALRYLIVWLAILLFDYVSLLLLLPILTLLFFLSSSRKPKLFFPALSSCSCLTASPLLPVQYSQE